MKKYTVIDLFCGCGGLSQGFIDAGFDVLLGVDNDQMALNTFEYNHHTKGRNIDLSLPSAFDLIKKEINNRNVDVVIAGPPCQGFSLTGPRNFDDKRNKLYLSVIETVKIFQPKAFLIENVVGMATLYGGKIKDEIIRRFTKLGYTVTAQVVCAADYGVPQMRKRLVFVGIRKDIGTFTFPTPLLKKENYVTCEEAIGDLPSREYDVGKEEDVYTSKPISSYQKIMRKNSDKLMNHVASQHSDYVKGVIAQVPDGGNYKDLPDGVGTSRKFHVAWTRYAHNKPSNTIDTGHRNHFHYKFNRIPTVRENARLQSFPDNFVFLGNKTQQNRQVGNAVPPLLSFNIAKKLKKVLENPETKKK